MVVGGVGVWVYCICVCIVYMGLLADVFASFCVCMVVGVSLSVCVYRVGIAGVSALCSHAPTHPRNLTDSYSHTHTYICTHILSHTVTVTFTYTHTLTHTHTTSHTQPHTHKHTHTHSHTLTPCLYTAKNLDSSLQRCSRYHSRTHAARL